MKPYTLEVYKKSSRKYRTVYTGKLSGVVKRIPTINSLGSRFRVKDANGEQVSVA